LPKKFNVAFLHGDPDLCLSSQNGAIK